MKWQRVFGELEGITSWWSIRGEAEGEERRGYRQEKPGSKRPESCVRNWAFISWAMETPECVSAANGRNPSPSGLAKKRIIGTCNWNLGWSAAANRTQGSDQAIRAWFCHLSLALLPPRPRTWRPHTAAPASHPPRFKTTNPFQVIQAKALGWVWLNGPSLDTTVARTVK